MKNILILLLLPFFSQAQLTSIIFSGDTAFVLNPSTGARVQLNKFPAAPANILDAFPVGSVYISTTSTNPSQLFGGTWEAFAEGRTLVGLNPGDPDFDTPEETGGAKTKTLSAAEMPAHTHTQMRLPTTTGGLTGFTSDLSMNGTPAATSVETGSAGSGTAFSIMNPYVTVYIFKRTN